MKFRFENPSPALVIIAFSVFMVALCGWVANIVKLVGLLDGPVTGWMLARGVGIFVGPLGAILGYM